MNTQELLRAIFVRLKRLKVIVIVGGLLFAILLFFYAHNQKAVYTSKATVFPLTTPADNSLAVSTISSILGSGSGDSKSFSSEAVINIIELATSRNVAEAVASTKLPEFGNKTITELLIKEANNNKSIFSGKDIEFPADSFSRAVLGGDLIKPALFAKMSKNGVLELYFSCTNVDLVTPISYVIIDRISQFYINLKIQKALSDYKFTLGKIDSFQNAVNALDQRAIGIQNSTFFTPTDRLEFELPKNNLSAEKIRVARQRDISVNNREEAVWRLQKATPIIQILDKPTQPFEVKKPSSVLYAFIGLVVGFILTAFFLVFNLLFKYIKAEIHRSIFGNDGNAPVGNTAA